MTIPFKSRPVAFHQHPLFPSNIFDLLPPDHVTGLIRWNFEIAPFNRKYDEKHSKKASHRP
jgi:hypothetical protein